MALLEIRHVYRSYARDSASVMVLEDISFSIGENEFVALVGPSGCGKSTLLRMVLGLDRPTQGEVLYRGAPVTGINDKVAMVFQSFALLPWLTVMDNVALGLEAKGVPRAEQERIANIYLDKVGLDGFERAYPRELSGGMKQRVGLARALCLEPELLCMDEPFSALDALTAENLRAEVLEVWDDPQIPPDAVLMVTHSIDEAVFMADRVIVFSARPGHILAEVSVSLPRPRNHRESEFQKIVDQIYGMIA